MSQDHNKQQCNLQPSHDASDLPSLSDTNSVFTDDSFGSSISQLQKYQIELEMQNEALHQSSKQLQVSHDRFVDYFECSPVGYLSLTKKGVVVEINMTGSKFLRAERAEILGNYFSRYLVPKDADYWHLFFKELLRDNIQSHCELTLQCTDGTNLDVRLDGLLLIKQEQAPRALIVLTDISERCKSAEALIHSEARWKFAIEGAGDGLWDWNLQTGHAFYSQRYKAMLGFAEDEIGNTSAEWVKRIHPDDAPGVFAAMQPYLDGKPGTVTVEFRMLCKDSSWQWTLGRGMIVKRDAQGNPLRMIGTNTDITERKRAEQALKEAQQRAERESQVKTRFLAAASHDLRQPAHALGMFVARLKELQLDNQATQLVNYMDASVQAMQDMLDGFFNISHLDSDSAQVHVTPFQLEAVFDKLRQGYASAARNKGLHFRVRASKAWVLSDPILLHRVLLNLVSNAVQYTHQGSILVACRPTGDGRNLRIQVWDSGIGIACEHHQDIFNEFFQVGNSERDRSKGLGVGLSIVDRACRLLNHSLSIRSALGCGTRFTLIIPVAQPKVDSERQDTAQLVTNSSFDGVRVFLIEDDKLGRVGLANLLTSWGCSVTTAEGAQAAADLFHKSKLPDITISDFRLGCGINGVEAVNMLSSIAGERIAAFLISGDTGENVRVQAEVAGLTLLQKPVRPAKLRNLLRSLLRGSSDNQSNLPPSKLH